MFASAKTGNATYPDGGRLSSGEIGLFYLRKDAITGTMPSDVTEPLLAGGDESAEGVEQFLRPLDETLGLTEWRHTELREHVTGVLLRDRG